MSFAVMVLQGQLKDNQGPEVLNAFVLIFFLSLFRIKARRLWVALCEVQRFSDNTNIDKRDTTTNIKGNKDGVKTQQQQQTTTETSSTTFDNKIIDNMILSKQSTRDKNSISNVDKKL